MKKKIRANKRIALFVPTLAGGGAERVMIMIANGLSAEGLKVDLITGNADGPYRDSLSTNVNLIDFGVSRLLYALPSFAKYLLVKKPSTVLSALNHANIANSVFSRLLSPQTKIILSVHNSLRTEAKPKLIPRLSRKLLGWAITRADLVISVSEGIREQLLEEFKVSGAQVVTIYNPLDVDTISMLSKEPSGHSWLDAPDKPVIIGVGSLTRQKNFELLIRSFSQVQVQTPSRLVILGEGEDREPLEKLIAELDIEDSVLMPGFVSNPFAWMSKSSVFVLSSDWEGLPGVLLEALACGVQVVSTDCKTGPNEILEAGKWGLLVGTGDQNALTDAIVESLQLKAPIDTKSRALDFSKEHAIAAYHNALTSKRNS